MERLVLWYRLEHRLELRIWPVAWHKGRVACSLLVVEVDLVRRHRHSSCTLDIHALLPWAQCLGGGG